MNSLTQLGHYWSDGFCKMREILYFLYFGDNSGCIKFLNIQLILVEVVVNALDFAAKEGFAMLIDASKLVDVSMRGAEHGPEVRIADQRAEFRIILVLSL
jgi:hypothetical protein